MSLKIDHWLSSPTGNARYKFSNIFILLNIIADTLTYMFKNVCVRIESVCMFAYGVCCTWISQVFTPSSPLE